MFRCLLALALVVSLAGSSWAAEELIIASGAGYKRLVNDISTAFTAKTGIQVRQVFGNMGQIVPQARESGSFDFLIGDKRYLDKADLAYAGEYVIGTGKLVAAVAKGCKLQSLAEITEKEITRIAMPDTHKAIYGHAADEYLRNAGLWQQIQPKILVVGTVPQVSAYVVSGEVDLGFINMTEAKAIASKVARLLPVDQKLYSPILILAKRLAGSPHENASTAFIDFLASAEVKALAEKHGL